MRVGVYLDLDREGVQFVVLSDEIENAVAFAQRWIGIRLRDLLVKQLDAQGTPRENQIPVFHGSP